MAVPNSNDLSRRLRNARRARGLSQRAAAQAIGVPRTAITQIEAGNRGVSTVELTKFAVCYQSTPESLLGDPLQGEDLLECLRRIAPEWAGDQQLQSQVEACVALCESGVFLQDLLGWERGAGPPSRAARPPSTVAAVMSQGERAADEERLRLNIGSAALADISELIVSQGVWVAEIDLPAFVSGLFARGPAIGLAIFVNASHAPARKRFSFAHEYAHALFDRDQPLRVSSIENSSEFAERRANAFAGAFLIPRNGLYETLRILEKGQRGQRGKALFDAASGDPVDAEVRQPRGAQDIACHDVGVVARQFGVTYQQAVYRLRSLGYVTARESVALLEQAAEGEDFASLFGSPIAGCDAIPGSEPSLRQLRREVAHLAIEAFRRKKIASERVVELGSLMGIGGSRLLRMARSSRAL